MNGQCHGGKDKCNEVKMIGHYFGKVVAMALSINGKI